MTGQVMQEKLELLISPYWNVNSVTRRGFCSMKRLLISPYWNVNQILELWGFNMQTLLISPYWNVNYMIDELQLLKDSPFNLSILECKSYADIVSYAAQLAFNLSILECKYAESKSDNQASLHF